MAGGTAVSASGYGAMLAGLLAVATSLAFGAVRVRARLVAEANGATARLAEAILALSALVVTAELLGILGVLGSASIVACSVVVGVGAGLVAGRPRGRQVPRAPLSTMGAVLAGLIALWLFLLWLGPTLAALDRGIADGDSLWYHMPFAARFAQDGSISALQFTGTSYLSWFYPANCELVHAVGILLAGHGDLLSPVISLLWLGLALLAAWCFGRPFGAGPASLAAVALLLGSHLIVAREPGAARTDVAGIAFLLAGAALLVHASERRQDKGVLVVAALALGLAVGTKLTLLPPAIILLAAMTVIRRGERRSVAAIGTAGVLATGGFWYLRNLIHAGNPLPWLKLGVGPLSLAPAGQGLGGADRFPVLHYADEPSVWTHHFIPALENELGALWPAILGIACAGLAFGLWRGSSAQRAVALAGFVAALAYLANPLGAAGPEGTPTAFAANLRYLAPALALGLVLAATAPPRRWRRSVGLVAGLAVLLLAFAERPALDRIGLDGSRYRGQLDHRLTEPGMGRVFRWAADVGGARIATTSILQYGLYGERLSNRVRYVGVEGPRGTFVGATSCREWRAAVDAGGFDYVVVAPEYDQPRPAAPASWTRAPSAEPVLRSGPTTVFRLTGPLDSSSCRPARTLVTSRRE